MILPKGKASHHHKRSYILSVEICRLGRVCLLVQLYDGLSAYLCIPKVGGHRYPLTPNLSLSIGWTDGWKVSDF